MRLVRMKKCKSAEKKKEVVNKIVELLKFKILIIKAKIRIENMLNNIWIKMIELTISISPLSKSIKNMK